MLVSLLSRARLGMVDHCQNARAWSMFKNIPFLLVVTSWDIINFFNQFMVFNPFTAKGELDLSKETSKGVTTQMKDIDEYFLMVVFTLLPKRDFVVVFVAFTILCLI